MFSQEEFYFVRHGQVPEANVKCLLEFPDTMPLNDVGRKQAEEIRQTIHKLPIRTVCHSPIARAVETKQIITEGLILPEVAIPELGECGPAQWFEMVAWEGEKHKPLPPVIQAFVERVRIGLIRALEQPGPVLIVAHGGVHWAICHHLCDKLHRRADASLFISKNKEPAGSLGSLSKACYEKSFLGESLGQYPLSRLGRNGA